jgi:hypothetical protein
MNASQYPQMLGQPYVPPAEKKRKKWPWIVGGIVLVFIAMIAGCAALIGGAAKHVSDEANRVVSVTYRVTGNEQTASITYTDKDFDTAQETNASVPWTKDVQISGFGKIASLTVTNGDADDAESKCEILVDGQVKYTQTAKGPYASANCSGDVG